MDPRDLRIAQLEAALKQLLDEAVAAGFELATDYNWPKALADAKHALSEPARLAAYRLLGQT